ncbi:MAG TPA: ABC transporter ATP-binding protein [Lachnospiraceae bacterium]|nr:ABC transporter ATP-binding protein [Lachnospiraceae bacterium]
MYPEKEGRTRYGMWSNSMFMVKAAWKHCKSVLGYASLEVVLVVAANLLELFTVPVILGSLEVGEPLSVLVMQIVGFVTALMLVKALYSYVACNQQFGRISVRVFLVLAFNEKMARTSYCRLDRQEFWDYAEKVQRITSDNRSATEAVWKTLIELLQNGIGFLIYLALLSSVDPVIILATVLTAVTGYVAGKRINSWGYRHKEEEAGYLHRMYYIAQKSGMREFAKDIRLFGMQGWLLELHEKWYRLYHAFQVKKQKKYLWGNIVDILLAFLRNGIIYAYLLHMTLQQSLSAAEFLLYFTAAGGFTTWITGILNQMTTLHQQSLELSQLREFMEIPEPFYFGGGIPVQPDVDGSYTLELRDVSYRYPGSKTNILEHMNLILHPGEKLAIVGMNGAGKTTLIKILCGFYDPTEGQVLLNGTDIREFDREEYYKLFSAVFQQFSVLPVSVQENVTQEIDGGDRVKAACCLEQAGLKELMASLPQGIDSLMVRDVNEDGVEFSGGQTQRLMLARALYRDAPILVLDEPTAALDPIAESDIYQRYHELSKGKSSIFISHRLASTRFCDRIILLEKGRIAEEGNHDTLLAAGGRYAELFEVQRQYYKEAGETDERE